VFDHHGDYGVTRFSEIAASQRGVNGGLLSRFGA
jgi:hypothetical protein